MMSEQENREEKSFEEAMEELEQLVKQLETGDVPLEKAITLYQNGMELTKLCNDKLERVEKQMDQILNEDGEVEPLTIDNSEV
ncbi:exodeoxyribonuclease VII small subunit [Salsuginibacillus kocurii]|uniref:exodeoxyribonuclease VII small subunit n=1 Tax=Salsuginibacillus kocurii TaxID=427078 RepID=UPI000378F823